MPSITTSSPYSADIISVLITADRLEPTFEVRRNVTEINIFENLDTPYLTASMLLEDTNNLVSSIGFKGTERVKITLSIEGDDTSRTVEKTFIVTDIKTVPTQDTSELLRLNLVEDIAYLSRLINVSKKYDGKPEIIIAKILKDNLDIDILVPQEFEGSAASQMKVIVPNMTPFQAVKWVKSRLVSSTGMPFFLYSTLNGDKLYLNDLEYLLGQPLKNPDRPYAFGQAFNRWSAAGNVQDQARNIESYSLPKSEDMVSLIRNGAVNSSYQFFDPAKRKDVRRSTVRVSMKEVLDKMEDVGIITNDQRASIYDQEFKYNDKSFEDYTPTVVSQIAASNSFTNYANYFEAEDIELQKLKSVSKAVRNYLFKSPLEIVMPGFDFLGRGEDSTIGRQIRINFLKNDPEILDENRTDVLDARRSGKYMIYAARHMIKPDKSAVAMSCTKLANLAETSR